MKLTIAASIQRLEDLWILQLHIAVNIGGNGGPKIHTLYSRINLIAFSLNSQPPLPPGPPPYRLSLSPSLSFREYPTTFIALTSYFKQSPRLCFCPSAVSTIKLEVIFDNARPDMPAICAASYAGKYLSDDDCRELTISVKVAFSVLSEGKNYEGNVERQETSKAR